jgi:glyoxylase-like metal-dependent hydrolase (beta-lactamase superfamily II)
MSAPTGKIAPTAAAAWPTETFFGRSKEVYFNGEPIEIIHVPNAHTDGDSIVFFRRSDVVAAGDIYVTTAYPVIDLERSVFHRQVCDCAYFVDSRKNARSQTSQTAPTVAAHTQRICISLRDFDVAVP